MYIPIKSEPRLSGLGWFIDATIGTTRTSAGHEKLTELAASGLVKDPNDLAALNNGTRLPDLADPKDHIKSGEEHRHFLRSVKHSSLEAWGFAIGHLKILHQQMMSSSNPVTQFRLIGEALHLIQDSFAPAHVNREPATGDILNIFSYGPTAPRDNHLFHVDPRDNPFTTKPRPALTPDARRAIGCSREYLRMALRHIQLKQMPFHDPKRDLNAFISRRLWLKRPDLRLGSSGVWVQELEGWLNGAIGARNLNVSLLRTGGKFDSDMQAAVLAFQNATSLTPNGIVGKETWQKLLL